MPHLSTSLSNSKVDALKPCDRLTRVLPALRVSKKPGALMSYHSLRVKGSTTFFLMPFLPFDKRLFCNGQYGSLLVHGALGMAWRSLVWRKMACKSLAGDIAWHYGSCTLPDRSVCCTRSVHRVRRHIKIPPPYRYSPSPSPSPAWRVLVRDARWTCRCQSRLCRMLAFIACESIRAMPMPPCVLYAV